MLVRGTVYFGTPAEVTIGVIDLLVRNVSSSGCFSCARFHAHTSLQQCFTVLLSQCHSSFFFHPVFLPPFESSHPTSRPVLQVKNCPAGCHQSLHLGLLLKRMAFLMTPNHQVRHPTGVKNLHVSPEAAFFQVVSVLTLIPDGAGVTFPAFRGGQPLGVAACPAESSVARRLPALGGGGGQRVGQSHE